MSNLIPRGGPLYNAGETAKPMKQGAQLEQMTGTSQNIKKQVVQVQRTEGAKPMGMDLNVPDDFLAGRTQHFRDEQQAQYGDVLRLPTADPDDLKYQLVQRYVKDTGIIPGVGKVLIPPDSPFFKYVERKEAEAQREQYKMWLFQQVDLSTPQARAWWEKRFPELTQAVAEAYKMQVADQARLFQLQLTGIQNMDDLWFLYNMNQRGPIAKNELNTLLPPLTRDTSPWGVYMGATLSADLQKGTGDPTQMPSPPGRFTDPNYFPNTRE